MSSPSSKVFALLAGVALFAGCSHPPPPKPPEPPPEVEEEEPPPPPPPKCEALDENCAAKKSTRAKIAKTDLVMTPPSGWAYAQTADATVAQLDDKGATMAATAVDVDKDAKDAKKRVADREAAFEALAKQIAITPPKKKINWKKKPDDVKKVAGLEISLWQLDGGARGDKKGPLLVFTADVGDTKELVGIGFVPGDDNSGSDEAILKAIESIGAKDDK